ncbi:Glycosyltransferase AglE [uncultured archaeon]|nr:Glycosyltransferase AglE [uncultured archaeon]
MKASRRTLRNNSGHVDVSVIVPAYNEEKYIRKALQSIARQKTKLKYEIIVSDGRSADRTVRIAERYADRIVTSRKKGIWAGRNAGAAVARGKLLVFIDADTTIPPEFVESVHAAMHDRRITGMSCGFKFDQHTRPLRALEALSNHYLYLLGGLGKGELQGFNCVMRKSDFLRVGGFPNKPLEDGAMARKLQKIGRVVFFPAVKVTTSARRMLKGGMLRSIQYYTDLEIMTYLPAGSPFHRIVRHKGYHPLR